MLTTGEKMQVALFCIGIYIVLGTIIGWILDDSLGLVPMDESSPASDYVAVVAFWPLFVIKYLAIGIWAVLNSGVSLLF